MSDPVDVGTKPPTGPTYLGDAVYASFDGYHINLHLNCYPSDVVVALDPDVMGGLIAYSRKCYDPGRG